MMHILLTNDDGIDAQGIHALCDALVAAGHRVSVCAPARQQSAVSHAITLGGNLIVTERAFEGAERAYAVEGTPADSARSGLCLVPDAELVISGINNGANMGGACIYSGTVGAAMEASMAGRPALAVSLTQYMAEDYAAAAAIATRVAEWMPRHPLPRGAIYSLNVPYLPYEQIRGVRAARLANTFLDDPGAVITDAGDCLHCDHSRVFGDASAADDTDEALTARGWATLTALTWNLRLEGEDPSLNDLRL